MTFTMCGSGSTAHLIVSKGYWWLMGVHTSFLGKESWNWISRLCAPSNIKLFLWQLWRDYVHFRSILLFCNLISSNLCPICNQRSQDMLHALFSCTRAKDVWSFCLHELVTSSNQDNLITWMKEFISNIGPLDPLSCGRFGVLTTNVSLRISSILSKKLALKCYHFCIMSWKLFLILPLT